MVVPKAVFVLCRSSWRPCESLLQPPDRNLTVRSGFVGLQPYKRVVVGPLEVQVARSALLRTLTFGPVPLPTGTLSGRAGSSEHNRSRVAR